MNAPARPAAATARPFEALDLSLLAADGGRVWVSAVSRQGEVHGVPCALPVLPLPPGAASASQWFTTAVGQAQRERATALAIGQAMSELVFGVPEVGALLDRTRGAAAERGANFLLRLLAVPDTLGAWPWELMTDPRRPDQFLALQRDTHLVRTPRARTFGTRAAPLRPPLSVLFIVSSPMPGGPGAAEAMFDLFQEKRALLDELRPLIERGLLQVEVEQRPTVERLRSRVARRRGGFHVVHYLGHARPEGLLLEDALGLGRLVPAHDFAAVLRELPELRLAVFAGCETARAPQGGQAQPWPGQLSLADLCVRDASPAVVGMQAVLPFATERLFTGFFYRALTAGRPVAEALRLARLAVAGDEQVGDPLLDWAVPCLFAGGGEPGALLDPAAAATPPPRRAAVVLRLDARQGERRFFARQAELREAIDVLGGHNGCRLLQITGPAGAGKSSVLDRALDELDDGIGRLYLRAPRLLAAADPLGELATVVHELAARLGTRLPARGRLDSAAWWERMTDTLVELPLALALDDADALAAPAGAPVVRALLQLAQRRGRARVALAADAPLAEIGEALAPGEQRVIRLGLLGWPEVWDWIRRNLPALTRFGEEALQPYFADLGPRMESWAALAEAVAGNGALAAGDLQAEVEGVAATLARQGARDMVPPPLFGTAATPVAAARAAPDTTTPAREPLRVAIAGPFTAGRQTAFARAVTALAAQHRVGGRAVSAGAADGASALAQLLDLDTPFDHHGTASTSKLLKWLAQTRQATVSADIVLLDFGGPQPSKVWGDVTRQLHAAGTLVVAAGGHDAAPLWPAWCPEVLAVGAHAAGMLAPKYARGFDAASGKPELFAPHTLAGTPFAAVVEPRPGAPDFEGSSAAALLAVGAAVLVWGADRGQRADDVQRVLLQTATPIPGGGRALDLPAALAQVRRQLLLDALEAGPMERSELLAETGLPAVVAMPLVEALLAAERIGRSSEGARERLYSHKAAYRVYEDLRRSTASGPERTAALEQLLAHVEHLAQRGRYSAARVAAMWASGEDGRRVMALGAMRGRESLRDFGIVLDAIAASRSAFEQYEALQLAQAMLTALDGTQRAALTGALQAQRGTGGHIADDDDRAPPADALLAALRAGP